MKIAIIADIHANLPALEAVLEDVSAQNVERILVNGDLVNRGPSNVEVVRWLLESGAEATLGNHDDLMRMWIERDPVLPAAWYDDPFWASTGWSARALRDAKLIRELRRLPMTLRVDLTGAPSLLLAHGSPRHYREGYGKHLTDRDISEITQMHPAEVLVGSHTHQPLRRRWGRYLVLNTGSVGSPFDGDLRAQYLLLELRDGRWHPEFRRVPYDHVRALARFSESGLLEDGGLSAEIFYQELLHARSYLVPFLMWSEERGRAHDESAWHDFRACNSHRFRPVGAMATNAETVVEPLSPPPPEDPHGEVEAVGQLGSPAKTAARAD